MNRSLLMPTFEKSVDPINEVKNINVTGLHDTKGNSYRINILFCHSNVHIGFVSSRTSRAFIGTGCTSNN